MATPRNSTELSAGQVQAIERVLFAYVRYLRRLLERMERRQFPPYDPLYLHVQKTLKDTGDLCHYLGGVAAGFAHIRVPEPKELLTGETRVEQLERWKKLEGGS